MSTEGDGAAGPEPADELQELRRRIEAVDLEIIDRFAERLDLSRRAGAVKRGLGTGTLDPSREAAVIRRAVEAGRERGLPEEAVRALFWTLVGACRDAQLETR